MIDLRAIDRQLRALVGKPRSTPLDIRIGTGVEARVDRSGIITFTLRYKLTGGGQRRVTLGTYSDNAADKNRMTSAAALVAAQNLRAQTRSGVDVALEAQRGEAPVDVADLCDAYLVDKVPHLGASLAKAQKRDLAIIKAAKVGSLSLGSVRIGDVRKADLSTFLLKEYAQRLQEGLHAAASIASIRSTLRMTFGYAEDRGWLQANPASGLKAPSGAVLTERDRTLSPTELADLWRLLTAPKAPQRAVMQQLKRQALLIIMLTGTRASEVLNRRRKDFDLVESTMTITGAKTSASNRTIPLSPVALQTVKDILAQTPAAADALLFPAQGKDTPIASDNLAGEVTVVVEALGHTQPEPWTCHDTRRTIISWMEGPGGIDTQVVRKLVGHVGVDVHQRVYSKDPRLEDMRKAVLAYEQHVAALAAPKGQNIVSINQGVAK